MKKYMDAGGVISLILPKFIFAAETGTYENPIGGGVSTIPDLIKTLLSIIVKISIPIAVAFIVYSGFLFIMAQGNEAGITKAKNTLMWTLVGMGLLLGAWFFAAGFQDMLHSIMG